MAADGPLVGVVVEGTSDLAVVRVLLASRGVSVDPTRTQVLVNARRSSRRRDVRSGVVPPRDSRRPVGPGYVAFLSDYCQQAWRPDVAAGSAPSLRRALADIDRMLASGAWT